MTRRPHPAWCVPIAAAFFAAGWFSKPAPTPPPARAPAVLDEQPAASSTTVYVTRTGTRYHRATCQHAKTGTPTTLDQARARGLTPCQRCSP